MTYAMIHTDERADNPFYHDALASDPQKKAFIADVRKIADPAYKKGVPWAMAIDFAVVAALKEIDPDDVVEWAIEMAKPWDCADPWETDADRRRISEILAQVSDRCSESFEVWTYNERERTGNGEGPAWKEVT